VFEALALVCSGYLERCEGVERGEGVARLRQAHHHVAHAALPQRPSQRQALGALAAAVAFEVVQRFSNFVAGLLRGVVADHPVVVREKLKTQTCRCSHAQTRKNKVTHTRAETVQSRPSRTPVPLLAHANYLSQDGSAAFVEFFEFCIKHGHYIRAEFGVVLCNGREVH
jgi:hypothetical protein